jgi:negative regulator of flagellin synthesis FlgM
MNTTISNNGLPKFTQATSSSGNGPTSATAAPAGSASAASQPDDQLKLTDSARALQQAARADEAAAIDPQRVERVRQALANGSYQINPGRIADNMLSLERQIGGTDKA